MYQVYMRTLLYLSNIICHCDTHVGGALSSYSLCDKDNKWQMTLYNMAYHWFPLCLSQEKWIMGFWNMQVQQMWWRKLLTAFIATVTMWRIVMQLKLQHWVELKHTPHHVAWKLCNTADKNGKSVHFIPTQTHIHQFSWIWLYVRLLIIQFTATINCFTITVLLECQFYKAVSIKVLLGPSLFNSYV
jgi:hypothetical protein